MDDFEKRAREAAESCTPFTVTACTKDLEDSFVDGANWAHSESEVLKAEIKQLKAEIDDRQVDRDALYLVRQDYKSLKTDFLHKTEHLCTELGKKDVEIERLEAELEQVKAALSRRNTRNLELKAENELLKAQGDAPTNIDLSIQLSSLIAELERATSDYYYRMGVGAHIINDENKRMYKMLTALETEVQSLKEALSTCVEIIDDPGAHGSAARASALSAAKATINDGDKK